MYPLTEVPLHHRSNRPSTCGLVVPALGRDAQPLGFLDLAKNASFLNWKLSRTRVLFLDGH